MKKRHYVWKAESGGLHFTDYKKKLKGGFVEIDGIGPVKCKLLFSHYNVSRVHEFIIKQIIPHAKKIY